MNYALVIRHLAQMSHDLHLYVKQDKLIFGQYIKTSSALLCGKLVRLLW